MPETHPVDAAIVEAFGRVFQLTELSDSRILIHEVLYHAASADPVRQRHMEAVHQLAVEAALGNAGGGQ